MRKDFLDRLFAEIDDNSKSLTSLAKSVYQMEGVVKLLSKFVLCIITVGVITYAGIIYKFVSDDSDKQEPTTQGQLHEKLDKYFLKRQDGLFKFNKADRKTAKDF